MTSSLVADLLAEEAGKYKGRIIVTHPFNPCHMIPYFELCRSKNTAPGVIELAKKILESLDRKPVVLKKATPGFIGNRLQYALAREATYLVESGICEAKDVDTCLKYSFCPRYTSIGLFDHFDTTGLDLHQTLCNIIYPTLSNIDRAPDIVNDKVARGDIGRKGASGKGFYDWNNVDMAEYQEKVNEPFWKFINWQFPKA
jgi:3-hydroxybutyryl-CoA dehydrogenase